MQVAPVVLTSGVLDLDRRTHQAADRTQTLSDLEVALLGALLEADGRPVSRETLLREVWGYHSNVRSRSVDHTVKRLRAKIELDRKRPVHLLTVHQVGYRFVSRAPEIRRPDPGFVGRASELDALAQHVARPVRLTVLGPGGMGKSALVRRAVEHLPSSLWDQVWWADLDQVEDDESVWTRILEALEAPPAHRGRPGAIGRQLAGMRPGVLVLDGAERWVAQLAEVIPDWRRGAPELRIVVTSRVRVHDPGEALLELGPLAEADARQVLWDRVTATRPDVPDDPSTRSVLAELADRLDRMPLALELAAGRANLLSPSQLLAHVERRMELLASPRQSLSSVLEASWALASADEQDALVQLSVFRGGFTTHDAVAVLGGSNGDGLRRLQALRDQSWLRAWHVDGTADLRLSLYESARDFVSSKAGDVADALRRHAEHFAEYGAAAAIREARRGSGSDGVTRYGREHANLQVALRTAVEQGRAGLAVQCWRAVHKWLHHRGPFGTSLALAEQVLSLDLPPELEAQIRHTAADLHRRVGDVEMALQWAHRAVILADDGSDDDLRVETRTMAASLEMAAGRLDDAARLLEDAEAVGTEDPLLAAQLHYRRGVLEVQVGALTEAQGRHREAMRLALRSGDGVLPTAIGNALAGVESALGDPEAAIAQYQATIDALEELGAATGYVRMNLANLHADLGHYDEARGGYAAAMDEALRHGNPALRASVLTNLATVQLESGQLDEAAATLHEALAMHRRHGVTRLVVASLIGLGEVGLGRAEMVRARARFEEARQEADTAGLSRHVGSAVLGLARVALEEGQITTAEELAEQAEARLRAATHATELARALCVRGLVAVAQGTRPPARRWLVEAEALAPEAAGDSRTEVGQLVSELRHRLEAT